MYKDIYPSGSQPVRIYGLPKMHKSFDSLPTFRPIISSIRTYLGISLCDLIP